MSIEEFFVWGEILHHPQLILGSKGVLKHGREEWELLRYDATGRVNAAITRLEMLLSRVHGEKENYLEEYLEAAIKAMDTIDQEGRPK